MIDYGKAGLAVIGMGWIGEYMVPCYERLLGNGYESRILAVKATDRRLEELRKRYGFEIMAGDCLERLKALRPAFLVLSVRPYEMAGVVEGTVKPYIGFLRNQGAPMPLIISFAPSPRPEWYTQVLGEDVRTVCVLPAMETSIGGVDVYSLASSQVTYDQGIPLAEGHREAVGRFLEPLGKVLWCTPEESMALLSMNITYHMLYLLCFALEGHYGAGGCARAAGILYALNCGRLGRPGLVKPVQEPEEADKRQLAWLEKGWYEGAFDFAAGHGRLPDGAPSSNVRVLAPQAFELHLLSLQLESRQFLEEKLKDHATPGGMTEKAVKEFKRLWEEVQGGAHGCRIPLKGSGSMAYDISYRLAEQVYQRGISLERG